MSNLCSMTEKLEVEPHTRCLTFKKKHCLQYLPLNNVFSFETLLTFYDSMSNGDVGWMILPVSTGP